MVNQGAAQSFINALIQCVEEDHLSGEDAKGIIETIEHDKTFLLKNGPLDPTLNLDFDWLPGSEKPIPTPSDAKDLKPKGKGSFVSEWFELGMASLKNNKILSIDIFYDGDIVHNMAARPGSLNQQNSKGAAEQALHVDATYIPIDQHPDLFSLYCLRGHEDANTVLIDVQNVLNKDLLTQEEIDLLSKKKFELHNGKLSDEYYANRDMVILNLDSDGDFAYTLLNLKQGRCTLPDSEPHRKAFEKLKTILEDPKILGKCGVSVNLQAGDYLSIDNRTFVHGRTGFVQLLQELYGRWLQRTYEQSNLRCNVI